MECHNALTNISLSRMNIICIKFDLEEQHTFLVKEKQVE